MTESVERAGFQDAAVKQITRRLSDRRGSRRFLLADEVGLGKTIVARGVIDELAAKQSSSDPLRVIYLCSNAEIAEQNRRKLAPEAERPIGRVTELALNRPVGDRRVVLYSFTPGTSLNEGTGMAWERRLLLYLLHRALGIDVSGARWRRFFRCTAGEENWMAATRWSALDGDFHRQTSTAFQEQLAAEWRAIADERGALIRRLTLAVDSFDESSWEQRRARNAEVARLRGVMQRVALRAVEPHLIILDEVQRFPEVLAEAHETKHLASELFRARAPVLILSATPYRLLTLDHEASEGLAESHKDFFNTLSFLFDRDVETPARVKSNFERFGQRLRTGEFFRGKDDVLLSIKRELEEDLRMVVARTERNWYVLDAGHGVTEPTRASGDLPGREELEEYFWIHRALGPSMNASGPITEFWKSAPSVLTFLDASYVVLRRLRDDASSVPRQLLWTSDDGVEDLERRNHRLRYLIDRTLGAKDARPALWTRPTYTYHRDPPEIAARAPQRKLLVFSGWRFVPKLIAVVASRVAHDRLGGDADEKLRPLTFAEKRAFHIFDLCFPSPVLASIVNPRAPAAELVPGEFTAEEALEAAERSLREALTSASVRITPTGSTPLWRVVARLERHRGHADAVRSALHSWGAGDEHEASEHVLRHRDEFREWLADRSSIAVSEMQVRRLALIATCSPAVALFRALRSTYGADADGALGDLVQLTFGSMRRYFNRPLVQQAVRRHEPRVSWKSSFRSEQGYVERALFYSCDEHLQAVLDEYAHLVRHAAQCAKIDDALELFEAVWDLSRGSRRTNGRRGSGDRVRINADAETHATHFALAFGDDVARDAGPDAEAGDRMRKSIVREAFNSPFWPFVLATTSVGQEGLDFHLYCRDVHHWNLPSNPVDLEQREGRINRRDCLAVRASIARDWPLSRLAAELRERDVNPWSAVFERLRHHESDQNYKHGLYPHWLYECDDPRDTVRIERHVTFFDASRDARPYPRLKTGLALYRLVFCQAKQEDLLNDLEARLGALSDGQRDEVIRRLRGYMLSLSPVGPTQALEHAHVEAKELLGDAARLQRLLDDVGKMRKTHAALSVVAHELDELERVARAALEKRSLTPSTRHAVTALAYLRNPYDSTFDLLGDGGLDDDIAVIREKHALIT